MNYLSYLAEAFFILNIITRATKTKTDDKFMGIVGVIWSLIFEDTRKK